MSYPEDSSPQSRPTAGMTVDEMNRLIHTMVVNQRNRELARKLLSAAGVKVKDGAEQARLEMMVIDFLDCRETQDFDEILRSWHFNNLLVAHLPIYNTNSTSCQQEPAPANNTSTNVSCCKCEEGSIGWVLRNLICLGLSFMVLYIAMKGAVNLQTSVNAEVGLGSAGLSSYYTGFLVSNIFLPTLFIRLLGCKVTVIVTILAYLPYIAGQLYPRFSTLVPGGLLAGLAAGPMWVAQGAYLSHMTDKYTTRSSMKGTTLKGESEAFIVQLFGVFYMLYQMSQVWGNLVSALVLSQGDAVNMMHNDTVICGADFCPGPTAYDHLANAKPASHHLNIINYSYISCILLAATIVFFGVDSIPRRGSKKSTLKGTLVAANPTSPEEALSLVGSEPRSNIQRGASTTTINTIAPTTTYGGCDVSERPLSGNSEPPAVISTVSETVHVHGNIVNNIPLSYPNGVNTIESTPSSTISASTTRSRSSGTADSDDQKQTFWAELSATARIAMKLDLLLLVPITAFLGVEDTFLASEYTSAYVTCAWGISHIGFVMVCYGVLNSMASACGGWIVKMTGRLPVVLFGIVLQTAVVIALRVWTPHHTEQTVFFAMAGLWGITDGIMQAQINSMYGIMFPNDVEAAYSNFRLWEGVGYILAYGSSTVLCTSTKLYLLFGIMIVGIIGYCIAEWRLRRRAERFECT